MMVHPVSIAAACRDTIAYVNYVGIRAHAQICMELCAPRVRASGATCLQLQTVATELPEQRYLSKYGIIPSDRGVRAVKPKHAGAGASLHAFPRSHARHQDASAFSHLCFSMCTYCSRVRRVPRILAGSCAYESSSSRTNITHVQAVSVTTTMIFPGGSTAFYTRSSTSQHSLHKSCLFEYHARPPHEYTLADEPK
jgi:hypothetical protein